jgi:hypothetical protein
MLPTTPGNDDAGYGQQKPYPYRSYQYYQQYQGKCVRYLYVGMVLIYRLPIAKFLTSAGLPTAALHQQAPIMQVRLSLWGLHATSYSEIYIGSNEIYNCNTGYSEGLTLGGNVQNFLIEMNNIHDIKNIGMDMSGNYSWTGAPANVNFARNGNIKNNTVYVAYRRWLHQAVFMLMAANGSILKVTPVMPIMQVSA